MVGALQNGTSVVVFEKDQVQFRAMQARLEQALGVHTTVLTVIPPDQQPKTLLVEPLSMHGKEAEYDISTDRYPKTQKQNSVWLEKRFGL